jgi:hypothetical protein
MKRDNLIGHHKFIITNPFISKSMEFDNLIIEATCDQEKWIEETTRKIGEWRGIFRSAYIKWAISINGLYLAKEKYETKKDDNSFVFKIQSLRNGNNGGEYATIAEWDAEKSAQVHIDTVPMICTYGFTDLYNCLEEFVFDFYRIYWKYNPDNLIKGPEFRHLRKLRKESGDSEESKLKWEEAFEARLDAWQRNKLYDNLGKVFLSYCKEVGLEKPKSYTLSTPETWGESIKGISIVRNSIVHGAKKVSKELGDFCKKPYSLGFGFEEGKELKIGTARLQMVEVFTDQLLTSINLSLVEKVQR